MILTPNFFRTNDYNKCVVDSKVNCYSYLWSERDKIFVVSTIKPLVSGHPLYQEECQL